MPSENLATLNPSRQLKPIVYRKPGEESKGGEYHGGPRRWTGKGPPPARHIPWPEIFKHHISVIEGHKKMVDMVRKHTVHGTGNWRTINDMFLRSDEMLRTSKQLSYSFVPPPDQRDRVPLGVSSDSMYPGYSPADHEYGKAAEEYGKAVAEANRRGVEIPKHPDIDYQVGQGKGVKRKSLAQIRELKQTSSGSEGEGPAKKSKSNGHAGFSTEEDNDIGAQAKETEKEDDTSGNPVFVIDTEPTPVNLPEHIVSLSKPSKRDVEDEETGTKKSKKSKSKHDGNLPSTDDKADQTEDISAEVDARMKAREEKRRQKEEKKRKRESEKSEAAPVEVIEQVETSATEIAEEKPKKKKKKVDHSASSEELADQKTEKTEKKKRAKHPVNSEDQAGHSMEKKRVFEEVEDGGEKKKKKSKHVENAEEHAEYKTEKKRASEDENGGEKKKSKKRRKY